MEAMHLQVREHQRWPASHRKLGEGHEADPTPPQPPQSQEGTNLISAFQPPELGDNEFLCVSPLSCGTLLRQPQQNNTENTWGSFEKTPAPIILQMRGWQSEKT